jgi:hypothetical protein
MAANTPGLGQPLPRGLDHVMEMVQDPVAYERDAIGRRDKKALDLERTQDLFIPQFLQFQVANYGAGADTVAFYQNQNPDDPFGTLLAAYTHWIHFER